VDGQPRSASARAKDCVSLKIFEKKEFFRLISQDSSSAYRLISRLCKQMRTITRRLAVSWIWEVPLEHRSTGNTWVSISAKILNT
jgi:hypothetical protein